MQSNLAQFASDPLAFFYAALVDGPHGQLVPFGSITTSFQRDALEALAPALLAVAHGEQPTIARHAWFWSKGAGKDSLLALAFAWLVAFSPRLLELRLGAADADQAAEVRLIIKGLLRNNPWLGEALEVLAWEVRNRLGTDSRLLIVAADERGEHGSRPDATAINELSHVGNEGFAQTLLDNQTKRPAGLLLIASNAGIVGTWQHRFYETIRDAPDRWHLSEYNQPAPWVSEADLAERRKVSGESRFRRLWWGQWADDAGGNAIAPADLESCIDRAAEPLARPQDGWLYVGGLDLSVSRDATAFVLLGKHVGYTMHQKRRRKHPLPPSHPLMIARDLGMFDPDPDDPDDEVFDEDQYAYRTRHVGGTGKLCVARLRVWNPAETGGRINLAAVEDYVLKIHRRFNLASLAVDPFQAERSGQALAAAGVPVRMTAPTAGNLQTQASALLEAVSDRALKLLPDDRLLTDLRRLRVVERGLTFRLESPRVSDGQGTRHGDLASALTLALLACKDFNEPMGEPLLDRPLAY
ncbi:MAG: hypothetical protein AB7O62_08550 [Pirellulales bacterium]